jgi:alanine-alpha-ketoisovalerate/valine-pyruvate aminotransferase
MWRRVIKLFVRDQLDLLATSGLAFNQEKSTAAPQRLLLEIPVGTRFNFFKYQNPNIQITSTQTVFFSYLAKRAYKVFFKHYFFMGIDQEFQIKHQSLCKL